MQTNSLSRRHFIATASAAAAAVTAHAQAPVQGAAKGQGKHLRAMEEWGDNWIFGVRGQF